MNEKIILIDAVYCLVDINGKINSNLNILLNKYDNRKIVLTNADNKEKDIFLRNISYETFSLKHNPDKVNPEYYKKFLKEFSLSAQDLIYFEHDIEAVESARSVGINTHYFDGNLVALEAFINFFLIRKQDEPIKGKHFFHYYPHQPIVIGVKNDTQVNWMPCVWNTGLSYNPFLYGISVGTNRYTCEMLREAKSFSINFLGFENLDLVRSLGRSSGSKIDKSLEFDITYSIGPKLGVPILDNSYLSFECKKFDEKTFGTHTLFVGEIVLLHTLKSLLNKSILDISQVSPILYLGADHYAKLNPDSLVSLKSLPFHESYRGDRINLIDIKNDKK